MIKDKSVHEKYSAKIRIASKQYCADTVQAHDMKVNKAMEK